MKVALFVEGANNTGPRGRDTLTDIWNNHLCSLAGLPAFAHVYGISKASLVSMNPAVRDLSGVGERFDQHLARRIEADGIEAAIVAWDLHPKWNSHDTYCRWNETLDLYRGLSSSTNLSAEWAQLAKQRLDLLLARDKPSDRLAKPILQAGMVLPIVMESMFEDLIADESLVRRSLGVVGSPLKGWPKGWNKADKLPDRDLLAPAVAAISQISPKNTAYKLIRQGWRTQKNEWCEYIVKEALKHPADSAKLLAHPVVARLVEVR